MFLFLINKDTFTTSIRQWESSSRVPQSLVHRGAAASRPAADGALCLLLKCIFQASFCLFEHFFIRFSLPDTLNIVKVYFFITIFYYNMEEPHVSVLI